MRTERTTPWVCAQLGSREHYAIPRALHGAGRLRLLLTDYWAPAAGGMAARLPGRDAAKASQRFHPELASVPVEHLGLRRLLFELGARLSRHRGWPVIMQRNALFQRRMLARLRGRWEAGLGRQAGVFFAYSYAALDLMRWFRSRGWQTILGQIDPGVREEDIVAAETERVAGVTSCWERAPAAYWRLWRMECEEADQILVNSEWSREALISSGVESGKIAIVPLAFETAARPCRRPAPAGGFSVRRPLRILFLGQLTIRKGAHLALEAARMLRDAPVEWFFVGPADLSPPEDVRLHPGIRWSGPVSREATQAFYREADVFLLPTLSDGFALTQLEAQAQGLPVIASRFCGRVVEHGRNGWILDPLSSDSIVERVRALLEEPAALERASAASQVDERFSLGHLAENLRRLEGRACRT